MTEVKWEKIKDFSEIIFERTGKIAKITMNRPEKHNAFTPETVAEMIEAFTICRDDSSIGVIILTGLATKPFRLVVTNRCAATVATSARPIARLNVLDLQHLIRIIQNQSLRW